MSCCRKIIIQALHTLSRYLVMHCHAGSRARGKKTQRADKGSAAVCGAETGKTAGSAPVFWKTDYRTWLWGGAR